MTNRMKTIAIGMALATTPLLATQATAQGLGVASANLEGALGNSAALRAAEAQIQAQYKPQIDAFNARRTAISGELDPMAREIQTLQANTATPPATLQAKVTAYRAREAAAQRELQPLAAPFQRPLSYAQEQVATKLDQALRAAMVAKRIGIIINPQAVVAIQPAADLTADVTTQLNALVKTVAITPPAGWQPGQGGQAAGAAPAAAAPAARRPQGR
ncbi:OmpH family outer membrane protein [Sphingomonas montana]|uniref:OmpH family outer membrane protein n=1 Tax=Sphingomonas montana TaxID=1843236 RepID=UPI00096C7BF6|nr:OmpH family outer membrane protein [Sphingomonas montana]